MSDQSYLYDYDPTGQAASNLRRDENHVLTADNGDNYHLIIPDISPFYKEGFVLTHEDSADPLQVGKDYIFTHQYTKPEDNLGGDAFGSITLLDRELNGNFTIESYQVMGGPHSQEGKELLAAIGNLAAFADTRTMADIIGLPEFYPPSAHVVDGEDLTDLNHVIAALQEVRAAISGEYKANHTHAIDQILGLEDRLSQMAVVNRSHKPAPANGYSFANQVGSVAIRLPKLNNALRVTVEVAVLSEDEPTIYYLSGLVGSRYQTVAGASWEDTTATYKGHRHVLDAFFTYDVDNYPTIYLGKDDAWSNHHVVIRSITIGTTVPQIYNQGYVVYFANDVTGEATLVEKILGLDRIESRLTKLSLNSFYPGLFKHI